MIQTISYGYSTLQIGTVTVYTHKLRIGSALLSFVHRDGLPLGTNFKEANQGKTIIEFTTVDYFESQQFIKVMDQASIDQMQEAINQFNATGYRVKPNQCYKPEIPGINVVGKITLD